jgi:hypothetical protein
VHLAVVVRVDVHTQIARWSGELGHHRWSPLARAEQGMVVEVSVLLLVESARPCPPWSDLVAQKEPPLPLDSPIFIFRRYSSSSLVP